MKTNYISLVQAARRDTINAGIDVNQDECSRFAVLNRAAWTISRVDPDVGLLWKPTGNNCDGYAVDVLCWPDGVIVDCLGAGPDGPCSALWQENAVHVDPSRWRAPLPPPPSRVLNPPVPTPDPPIIVAPPPVTVPRPEAPQVLEPPAPSAVSKALQSAIEALVAWGGPKIVGFLLGWWQKRQAAPPKVTALDGTAIPRVMPPSRSQLPK